MDALALCTLLRWLGPWAGTSAPPGIVRTERLLGEARSLRAYLYEPPGRALGAYLIAPGLHFLGPDDPRLDRFCRVLAAAGLLVLAPKLPDHLSLRVSPRTTGDLALAWDDVADLAARRRLARPAVFTISFGSAPAIELAARDGYRGRVGPLVLFGGFADFAASVRFAVTGEMVHERERLTLPRDPLNSPAVFVNLLPYLDVRGDRGLLEAAWREMAVSTWGRMELKRPGARDPFAAAIADRLPAELREVFLIGCGLRPGGAELLEAGLAAAGDAFAFADPRPHLARVVAPVVIVHGKDDDVIPYCQAHLLRAALPAGHRHRLHLTGMYGHTGAETPPPGALVAEGVTMLRVARAILDAPLGRI